MLYILIFIMGTILGSFLTCQAERISEGKDWIHGRSICDNCGHELGALDLVPIFSYILNGGKCRYCKTKIPISCIIGEILCGAIYSFTVYRFGLGIESIRLIILFSVLYGLSIVDLRKYIIPNGYIILGIINFIITAFFMPNGFLSTIKPGIIGGLSSFLFMLILSYLFEKFRGVEGIGGGDIKLLFISGLYLGFFLSIFNLILSSLIGLIFVLVLKKNKIPFGPAISISTITLMFFGEDILSFYFGLF